MTEGAEEIKDTRRRVKLYVLNDKRVWDDRGTGHVTYAYSDRHNGMALFVSSESDGAQLLDSKIMMDTAYQKQQETLIVWSEGENFDLALSFQEKAGCDDIWGKICQVQGKDPSVEITQDIGYEGESDNESTENVEPGATATSVGGLHLPTCELSRLTDINELFSSCLSSPVKREHLAMAIESEGYIKKLLELFKISEDLENVKSLHLSYQIFKSIFLLNKNALYETLFSEENISNVIGVLEYDASSPTRRRHREYLWKTAKFKEVIPIASPELKAKIHQTYRVQYIQDVILPTPSIFEENLLSVLSSFIFFNKVEIVSLIQDDERFLTLLFSQLTDVKTEAGRRRDLILFLREFCCFSQTLQPQNREQFFRTVSGHGILPVIEVCISSDDDATKSAAMEIFSNVVDYNPSMVREYILHQALTHTDDNALFLNIIIEQVFADKDPELGGSVQLLGILRVLIDPENMMTSVANKTEKTEFLSFFYKRCMANLCSSLLANTAHNKLAKDDYRIAHMLSLLLELLSFCIEHHAYHIRNYVLNKDILQRVLVLLKSKHTFLVLGSLRFLRRIVQLKDDFFNRYIVRNKLFTPVVECFLANGHRYNLLNSALLELFEFIRMEDIKPLCIYFVENYMEQFKDINYVQTFRALRLRYEQQQEKLGNKAVGVNNEFRSPPPTVVSSTRRRDQRDMDEDEEAWFNEDDEDEWNDSSPMVSVTSRPVGSIPIGAQQSLPTSPSVLKASCNVLVNASGNNVSLEEGVVDSTTLTYQSTADKENISESNKFSTVSSGVLRSPSPSSALNVSASTAGQRSTSPSMRSNSPSEPVVLTNKVLVDYDVEDDSDDEQSHEAHSSAPVAEIVSVPLPENFTKANGLEDLSSIAAMPCSVLNPISNSQELSTTSVEHLALSESVPTNEQQQQPVLDHQDHREPAASALLLSSTCNTNHVDERIAPDSSSVFPSTSSGSPEGVCSEMVDASWDDLRMVAVLDETAENADNKPSLIMFSNNEAEAVIPGQETSASAGTASTTSSVGGVVLSSDQKAERLSTAASSSDSEVVTSTEVAVVSTSMPADSSSAFLETPPTKRSKLETYL